jgi:hypothetical protein
MGVGLSRAFCPNHENGTVPGWRNVREQDRIADTIYAACGAEGNWYYADRASADAANLLSESARVATEARRDLARAIQDGATQIRISRRWLDMTGDGTVPSGHCVEETYDARHTTYEPGDIAIVDYGALGVGYCVAPVVVATGEPVARSSPTPAGPTPYTPAASAYTRGRSLR